MGAGARRSCRFHNAVRVDSRERLGGCARRVELLATRQLRDGRLPVMNVPSNNAPAIAMARKFGLTPAAELFFVT